MNLPKLITQFSDDARCRAYLERLRWPNSVTCPRCQSKNILEMPERDKYECNECSYQFTVTSGTIFHDTHLSLSKWFLAIYFMTESKKGMSALQIKRTLDIAYQTAWLKTHYSAAFMAAVLSFDMDRTEKMIILSVKISFFSD